MGGSAIPRAPEAVPFASPVGADPCRGPGRDEVPGDGTIPRVSQGRRRVSAQESVQPATATPSGSSAFIPFLRFGREKIVCGSRRRSIPWRLVVMQTASRRASSEPSPASAIRSRGPNQRER